MNLPLFILTWNPAISALGSGDTDSEREYQARVDATSAYGSYRGAWTTRRKRGISRGDAVVLLRQMDQPGIIASGYAVDEIVQEDYGENWVEVDWDRWVPVERRLPREQISEMAPRFKNPIQQSGELLADDQATALMEAWNGLHPPVPPGARALSGDAADVAPTPSGPVPEGAKTRVEVNRYERNQQNRERCIAEHGTSCTVCSMDFGSTYGAFAEGYIHVHHVVPLAQIEDHVNHIVDPVNDLVPVCPNCHAMLHLHPDKPCTVEKLRQLLTETMQG
ncbi:MAG: HNH endonuclease [Acidimicrobiaceae bacterium]|nr:HNH endonuclease [Acidimicrobiaceae bacterium]